MNYHIRPIHPTEIPLLKDFLYEAIFIPEGAVAPPRDIIDDYNLQVYIRDFGKSSDDYCLVAEADDIPSIAISLYKEYRNQGIGSVLLKQMLDLLKSEGYKSVSLSVQKANYAMRMYQKAGFIALSDDGEEVIMQCPL